MASTLAESDDANAESLIDRTAMKRERPGSERYQQTHMAMIFQQGLSFSGFERNKLFLASGDGGYSDVSDVSGADTDGDCRAVCAADYDDDGDMDLFVNAIQRDCHYLFRNDMVRPEEKAFVKLRLRATRGQRDAVGAIVELEREGRAQAQVLACGSGFESQNSLELVFGMGAANEGRVCVRWPGRSVEVFGTVERGSRALLVEGTGSPVAYEAHSYAFTAPGPRGVKVAAGEPLPPLAMIAMDGSAARLAAGGDKPLLINFWATTCASCRAELPALEALRESGRYRVVAVSLDPGRPAAAIERIWREQGIGFENYFPNEEAATRLFDLSLLSIPVSIIVAPDGRIERIIQGAIGSDATP